MEEEVFRVANQSNPKSIAGAIAHSLEDNKEVKLEAIGAGAVNQAVKAVAIARGFVAPSGQDLICTPGFFDVEIGDEERTGIRLTIESR